MLMYQCRMGKTTLGDVVMATNRNGDTSLHVAARCGHVIVIRQLHKDYDVMMCHVNNEGKTALHESAQNGHIECVNYLIEAGCYVDSLKRADWSVEVHYTIILQDAIVWTRPFSFVQRVQTSVQLVAH